MLLLAPAVDELCSAAPTVGAPGLTGELGLSVSGYAFFTLVAPLLVAMVLEPPLLYLSDGPWRRTIWRVAVTLWGLSYVFAAAAPTGWALAAALAVVYTAGGVTLGVTSVTLIRETGDPERTMTRWGLSAAVGDLLGPVAFAGLAYAGGGWRAAMLGCGLAVLLWAVFAARFDPAPPEHDVTRRWRQTLVEAVADRRLTLWLFAATLNTLLDEIMVAATALIAVHVYGASATQAAAATGVFLAGAVASLLAVERLHAVSHRVLVASCLLCLAGLGLLIAAPTFEVALFALLIVGFGAGPQYPLTTAAAYQCRPDRPGLVDAVGGLFAPLDILLPLMVGVLADRLGWTAAVAFVALQPVGILGVALWTRYTSPRGETS